MRGFPGTILLALVTTISGPTPTRRDPHARLDFVYLPGGTFQFGCEPDDHGCFADERPRHPADVPPLWMGKTEVTVAAFQRCVKVGACRCPMDRAAGCNHGQGREQHPMNCVDWSQAQAFCRWIGGRLPSAEEWEFAAKGGGDRIYPWGDAPLNASRANFCDTRCRRSHPTFDASPGDDGWSETAPVGSYPAGASKDGLLDLAGNVWEWTSTRHGRDREIRGGAWSVDDPRWFRTSNRAWWPPATRASDLGFRCVLPADHVW